MALTESVRPTALSARSTVLVAACAIVLSGVLSAQTPQTPATAGASQAAGNRLPVRRVVLYKSGVGYFEHIGRVRGNQTVTIDFTSGQLDDVLKSITTLDLGGGRIASVQYNTNESIDRRLGALALPLDGRPTRFQFLSALRGARIEVTSGASRVDGRLLSVDTVNRVVNGLNTTIETISVVTDAGELRSVTLEPNVGVRLVEQGLSQEVSK